MYNLADTGNAPHGGVHVEKEKDKESSEDKEGEVGVGGKAVLRRDAGNIHVKADKEPQKGSKDNDADVGTHQGNHADAFVFWEVFF